MEETLQTREGDLHIHVVDTEERRMPFPSSSLSVSILEGAKISPVPEEGGEIPCSSWKTRGDSWQHQ